MLVKPVIVNMVLVIVMYNLVSYYFLLTLGVIATCFLVIVAMFVFLRQKNPIIKIAMSGFMFINLIAIAFIFATIFGYNISYLIDIVVIYFILGFSSYVLYFVFFNKRS